MSQLLDQMRTALRARHYSRRTEQTYCVWVKRYVRFHRPRHPAEMGEPEINAFLTHLAVKEDVSASTQTQALCALLFLYRNVLRREVGELDLVRANKPRRLPVVLTREEVRRLLVELEGEPQVVASLLYGSGLRLMECPCLRVCDLEPGRDELLAQRQGRPRPRHHAAARPAAGPRRPTRASTRPARARPRGRVGPRRTARRPGAQVPAGALGVALAVGLPAAVPLAEP